jgi:hypothetical protein
VIDQIPTLVPPLPVTFAFQRDLAVHLPILAVAFRIRAMPQHTDKSSGVNPIFLFHLSTTIKTINHAGFVVLAHETERYRTCVR